MSASRPTLALAIATAGGVGYAPVAPGTFGSAVGLVLWWLLPFRWIAHLATIVLLFVGGAFAGSAAEQHFQTTDPGPVVIDEVMGMMVTMFLTSVTWKGAVLGFLLFRVFDIVKPFPARQLERLHGGVGVMADDFAAAIYANVALRACLWLIPSVR